MNTSDIHSVINLIKIQLHVTTQRALYQNTQRQSYLKRKIKRL